MPLDHQPVQVLNPLAHDTGRIPGTRGPAALGKIQARNSGMAAEAVLLTGLNEGSLGHLGLGTAWHPDVADGTAPIRTHLDTLDDKAAFHPWPARMPLP